MYRQKINHVSAIVPMVLSLLAFSILIVAVLSGCDKGYADEGSAAHIYQLLIVLEVPFFLVFVATTEWSRVLRFVGLIGLQAAALAVALAPVAFFKR
jgi:hypothetical protein